MDELIRCDDCGAIFGQSDIVRGYEEEKDSCPNCGSWALYTYREEEEEDG